MYRMSVASKRKNGEDFAQPEAGPSKKSMKMLEIDKNPPNQLKHINFDCLVKIFQHLSRLDLMNIIVYDMALMEAARFVFQKKFAKDLFHLSNKPLFDVNGKSRVAKYLQAFGGVIEELCLSYHTKYREFDRLIEIAILKNCSKNLIKIKLKNAKCHSMKNITEPFENVQEVEFNACEFGELIVNFSKWFPNVHTLILDKQIPQSYEYRRRLEKHHPALIHFVINANDNDQTSSQMKFNENAAWKKLDNYNVITFLKLNPQLKVIKLAEHKKIENIDRLMRGQPFGIKLDYELLTTIHEELKELQELYLSYSHPPLWQSSSPKIYLKKLQKLQIEFSSSAILKHIPLIFSKINHLSFKAIDVGSEYLKFIEENRNVKRLTLNAPWKKMRHFFNFIDLVSMMPNLREIRVFYQSQFYASNYVIELLNKCKNLDTLTMLGVECPRSKRYLMSSDNELEHIAGLIGPEWTSSICLSANNNNADYYVLIIERLYDIVELD